VSVETRVSFLHVGSDPIERKRPPEDGLAAQDLWGRAPANRSPCNDLAPWCEKGWLRSQASPSRGVGQQEILVRCRIPG